MAASRHRAWPGAIPQVPSPPRTGTIRSRPAVRASASKHALWIVLKTFGPDNHAVGRWRVDSPPAARVVLEVMRRGGPGQEPVTTG